MEFLESSFASNLPKQLLKFYRHCWSLGFYTKPNYHYLRKTLMSFCKPYQGASKPSNPNRKESAANVYLKDKKLAFLSAWKESFVEFNNWPNSKSPSKRHIWRWPFQLKSNKNNAHHSHTHSFALDFRVQQPNSFIFMSSYHDESEK